MTKYLWQVSYTAEGAKGLLSEGGSARRDAITRMVESVGGKVEACYYAFGGSDLYVLGEVPDEVAAAALSIQTAASGAAKTQSIALISPEQVDEAVQRHPDYRPPGG